MPALPLDEAGKYVAAAYVVFLALLLVYVAIMAMRLGRIDRELGELADIAEERRARGGGWLSCSPSASRTRPRRSSCASAWRSPRAGRWGYCGELVERAEILEVAAISTCNRTELYLVVADAVGAESSRWACSRARPGSSRPSWCATSIPSAARPRRSSCSA